MFKQKLFITILSILALGCGCSKSSTDNSVSTCDQNISYNKKIKHLFSTNCNTSGCHDDVVITSLSNYQTVHDGAVQIKNSILSGRMPKNKTLSAIDKNAIICWIDNGAKNN